MDELVGTIKYFSNTFAPVGWMPCDGRLLPVNTNNNALYSLIGTLYGGNGATTFALPTIKDPLGTTTYGPVGYCICILGVYPQRASTTTTTTAPTTVSMLLKTTDQTFNADVEKYTGTAIIWFTASWCSPCKAMLADVNKFAAINSNVKVMTLDIDADPLVPSKYAVNAIPTMIRFDAGKTTKTIKGKITYAQMVSGFDL